MRALLLRVVFVFAVCLATLSAAADCVTTTYPSNGATDVPRVSDTVTLKWQAVTGADGYDIYFGPSGSGCSAGPVATEAGTQWSPPGPLTENTTYEWKVVKRFNGAPDLGCTSSCRTFTTASCPAAPPTLIEPIWGEVPFGTVTLKWNAVANALGYEVYVGLDGDTPSLIGTTTANQKNVTIDPGRYVDWYVVAKAPSCTPQQSSAEMFNTSCPTTPASLQLPNNNATFSPGSNVFFKWTAVAGAASYDVKVSPDNGETWNVIGENINSLTFSAPFTTGTYLWEVRANFNGACDPLYSDPRTFSITEGCNNSAPALVSPENGATASAPVLFKWNVTPNVKEYRLYVQPAGGSKMTLTSTSNTFFTATLQQGTYDWWVLAIFEGCDDLESTHYSLTVAEDGCPSNPAKATLSSPANNATNLSSPVTFKWNAVTGAKGYRVIARLDGESQAVSLGLTTKTTLTADVPAGTHEWAVQTFFGETCPTTLSDRRMITVTQGAQCNNAAPQLLAPANGANNVSSPVTFTWSAVAGANNYLLYVAIGDGDFELYGETDGTSLQRLVPSGTIRWAVAAQFAACADVRSAVSTFTVTDGTSCPSASIGLLTPAEGATVASPVHLTWTAVTNAIGYRVWVKTDGTAPAAIARTTAAEANVSLPAGAIEWRVEALRAGCDSVLSAPGHFVVQKNASCGINAAPVLISPVGPENDRVHAANPVTLQWTAVANAIAYRVWLARDAQPFQDLALTRETERSEELEDGHYAWYVEAIFEGCDPVPSQRSFFEVEPPEGECGTAPVPLSPANGSVASSPVTFSWAEVEHALKYRVFVSIDGEEPIFIGSTEDTQLERPLPPGQIKWSVEAVFDECPSAFSEKIEFTIPRSQNCSDSGPELLSPPNGAEGILPYIEFSWSAVSGAVKYALVVEVDEGAPTILATTRDTHVTRKLPPGSHVEWSVIAFFASCDPAKSDEHEFDVAAESASCPTRAPILIFPAHDGPDVNAPVHFAWVGVAQAKSYRVWAWRSGDEPAIVATTEERQATVSLSAGRYNAYVEALFEGCASTESAPAEFTVAGDVACTTPRKPEAQVVGQALSNTSYRVRWTPLANVSLYELQESTSLDFDGATTFATSDISQRFTHEVTGAPVQYLYRVRGISSCNDTRGAYSDVVGVFVVKANTNNASAELGDNDTVVQKVFLPGSSTPLQFSVTTDKPWLHVTPANGTLPPEGITLTVTADPGVLPLGTNTGTIKVAYSGAGKGSVSNGSTTSVVPISVSLVTPVVPGGKSAPPPDSLIFPVAGHAVGVNDSLFESDIRITNLAAQTMKYQINFTPSATNGTTTGSSSTIEIAPGATTALDDIVSSLFGTGTTSSALGMLEVRPLTTSASSSTLLTPANASLVKQLTTAASSRTYNFTPNGTFGQFIPAIPFAQFVGRSQILSLQQVAQSSAYRANFGFAEASGQAVNLDVRVYDTANHLLATIPVSLGPSEHKQINGMLSVNGITTLTDGRVEVEVTSGNGKVTAYVSEIDNQTNDPLLVSAVPKGAVTSDRYVMPGMAYIDNGFAFWVSDLRIFNAGSTATPATLTFYPQGNPLAAVSREVQLDAGEVEVLDNIVNTLFGMPNGSGGSIVITTPAATTLTATARTYNQTTKGTYGQYIPGVTPADAVGVNDRPLQILQLEQSSRFRTNVGLTETTGQPATVQVSVILPDSLATPVVNVPLQANEFRQISLAELGLSDAYNARVTVKVIDGAGRVTAYGSAIDVTTQDPTFVPPQ